MGTPSTVTFDWKENANAGKLHNNTPTGASVTSTSAFHSPALCLPSSQLVYFSPLSPLLSPLIPAVANVLQEFTTIFIVPEWDLNSLIPLKTAKLATLGLSWFQGPDMDGRGPLFWASPGGIRVTIENLPLCVGRRAQSDSQRKNLK